MKSISYHEEEIGRFIKSSKTKLVWTFEFNGETYNLALKVSKLSGNYEVDLNEKMLYKGNHANSNGLAFPFKLQNAVFMIKQVGNTFDVVYDGRGFNSYKESNMPKRTTNLEGASGTRNMPVRERGRSDLSPTIQQNRNQHPIFATHDNKSPCRQTLPGIFQYNAESYPDGDISMQNARNINPAYPMVNEQHFFNLAPYMQFPDTGNGYTRPSGNNIFGNLDDVRPDANYFQNFARVPEDIQLRINGRHEYEKRGQHFLEINFPKGTENVNIIIDQVYNS